MKKTLLPLALLLCCEAFAQFQNVSNANGIDFTSGYPFHGSGCAFVDFNNDGLDDLTYAGRNILPEFYLNNGSGYTQTFPTFTPALPTNYDAKMALWFDYDNDGDKDFLYTYAMQPIRLYRNDGGMNFTEVTSAAGILAQNSRHMGAAAGDYDNDGWLDFYVCKYHNHLLPADNIPSNKNILYRNNGNGTFTDVTISSGVGTPCSDCYEIQASFMPVFLDYDRDGWQDIYVINDKIVYPNYLFRNNGDGTFENVTETSGAGVHLDAMSITVDDYDNDDDMDIFITNTYNENFLLNNQGDGTFEDVGESAGVSSTDPATVAWGALWLDYDNNASVDLYVGTLGTGIDLGQQALFYINNGDGTFSDGTVETNIYGTMDAGYTAAMGDMDGDGYYDFMSNNASPTFSKLWQNDGGTNNYFCATVEGTVSNRDGIGTWIEIWSDGNKYIRYTHAGENYLGQNSEKEIFGLGEATAVDSLHLIWPSGIEEWYFNPPVNTCNNYIEAQSFSNAIVSIVMESDHICPGDSTMLDAGAGLSYEWNTGDTTQTINALVPGEYFATLVNQYGFVQQTDTVEVMLYELPQMLEDSLSVTCYGFADGWASVGLSDGSVQTIIWSNDSTTVSVSGLAPGSYSYELSDSNGCYHTGDVEITEPLPMGYTIIPTNVLCNGDATGTVAIEASGGTPPYTYDWQGQDAQALPAGDYEMVATDTNGCEIIVPYSIYEPEQLEGTIEPTDQFEEGEMGTASITIEGGTLPYSILWSNGDVDSLSITGLLAGLYSVEVTDSNGCTWSGNFQVDFVEGILENSFSTIALYPNPAGDWCVISGLQNLGESDILVTDALGKEVKTIHTLNSPSYIINTNEWSGGNYFLSIIQNGITVWKQELIIEH